MKTLYAAALGAALILPGAAMAQSTTTTPGATSEPPASSGMSSPGTTTSPGAGQTSPGISGGSMTSPDTSAAGSVVTPGQTAAAGMAGEGHEVIGKKLQNAEGEELGEISNLLVDQQGQVAKLVVDAAEGGEKVELDWQRVTMNQDGEIQSTMKKDEVAELPKYEEKSN